MKKILLCLSNEDRRDNLLLEAAFSLTQEMRAFLLAFCPFDEQENESVTMGESLALTLPKQTLPDHHQLVYQNIYEAFYKKAEHTKLKWLEKPQEEDLPASYMLPYKASIPYSYWPEVALADLVIFSQTYHMDVRGWGTLESTLLDARRLVLVISKEHTFQICGGNSVIAWDGSIQASRSLIRSIPFLKRSNHIYLLCIERAGQNTIQIEPALGYLALYGIEAQIIRCPLEKTSHEKVGALLLEQASTIKANLLIMGGYGSSSSFLETLVGGVTQYVRTHTELNLLMTH